MLSAEVEVLDPKIKKIDLKIAEADMLESWNPVSDSNELLPPDDFVDDYVERKVILNAYLSVNNWLKNY